MKKDLQRITKIKTFINKNNWEWIIYPLENDNWGKFEKFNLKISLEVLYAKNEKIYPAAISKYNSNREKEIIFWLIPNVEGLHYLAVKNYRHC